MQKTENYGLNKPDLTDFYDVNNFNSNMDVLDTKLKEVEDKADPTTMQNHIADTTNPHEVTKSQVGLSEVPNVSTNNQTPTYTVPDTESELESGEKLSVAFGKIAKAVKSLISHLANKSNPHSVTKSQLGLGNVDNTSDANKPVSTATKQALGNYLPLSGGQMTGNISTNQNAIFATDGNLYSGNWGGWLSNALASKQNALGYTPLAKAHLVSEMRSASAYTIAAKNALTLNVNIAKSGYTPIGITGFSTGSLSVTVSSTDLGTQGTAALTVINWSSGSITATPWVRVQYVQNV